MPNRSLLFLRVKPPRSLSLGQPDHAEPAAEIAAPAPLPERTMRGRNRVGWQIHPFLAPSSRGNRHPQSCLGDRNKVGPAVETVAATPPAHAATAQQTKSLLSDLPALVSIHTKSSFPSFEQDLPSSSLSGPPDSVEPPVNPVGAADPTRRGSCSAAALELMAGSTTCTNCKAVAPCSGEGGLSLDTG